MKHRDPMRTLSQIRKKHSNKRMIVSFAEKFGMVYFGYVNQLADEHKLVRGLTVSINHHDTHYCVGSFQNYDVAFVERTDQLRASKQSTKQAHRWHVMQVDLRTSKELPHIFIGLHTHSETFYMQLFTKYPSLRSLQLGNLQLYSPAFLSKYRIYAKPAKILEVEQLLSPELCDALVAHFGGLAIEIVDHSVYVYSESPHLSSSLLEAMLTNGVWLAGQIDQAAKEVV